MFARTSRAPIVALLLVALATLPGCASLTGVKSSPVPMIAVQYATAKFIESEKAPEVRALRAVKVAQAVDAIKLVAGRSQITTVAVLQSEGLRLIAQSNLGAADRLMAQSLLAAVVTELSQRVGTGGVIADGNRVAIIAVLDWVRVVATAYGAT